MTTSSSSGTYPEITPAQAAELVGIARSACSGEALPERVSEIRELWELRIDTCNRRLAMLSDWVGRGLVIEAASVDESYPGLCKVSLALTMVDDRLAWDQACNRAGVPLNSRIDERSFLLLSDAVGDANSLDEFVQKFQLSVLARQPLGTRVRHLQELLAAAPRNIAIRALAKKYESEALATLELSCREAAARGDHDVLVDALEAIEGLGWQSQFSSEFIDWIRGETERRNRQDADTKYDLLAKRIEAAFDREDLMLLGALAEEVDDVEREHGLEPNDTFRERTKNAIDWSNAERARMRAEADHADACEALRRAIDQAYKHSELEPMYAAVLAFGFGIPEDLEARFQTSHTAWRTAKRRRASIVIAIASFTVAASVSAIAYLMHRSDQQERADRLAIAIAAMVDAGKFDEANTAVKGAESAEPWMLDVASVRAARERVATATPIYAERRRRVQVLLAEIDAIARDVASDDAKLAIATTQLRDAIAKTALLEKLTEAELSIANTRIAALEDTRARIRADRIRALTDEFAIIRRVAASLKPIGDRSREDRLSESATATYLKDVESLRTQVSGFITKTTAEYPERSEAQAILDRLVKDIAAAQELLPRLAEANKLIERLKVVPNSESEYSDLIDMIQDKYGEFANGSRVGPKDALADATLMIRAAKAIEHWRETVMPAIAGQSTSATVVMPASRDAANAIHAALSAHVQSFPTSPYASVARTWLATCDVVSTSTSESIGQSAMEDVEAAGLLGLKQIPIKGNRWVYARDGGAGTSVFAGALAGRGDLIAPLAQLRANLDIVHQETGKRELTPWSSELQKSNSAIIAKDAIAVQCEWLRMMQRIRATSQGTEPIAQAAVLLQLMQIYVDKLAIKAGADKDFCEITERLRGKYPSIDTADWPRIAIRPIGNQEREALRNDAKSLFADLPNFDSEADKRQKAWSSSVEQGRRAKVVGLLLPPAAGESIRRTSPADLQGTNYFILERDKGAGAWILRSAEFDNGKLMKGGAAAPPFTLIYVRN